MNSFQASTKKTWGLFLRVAVSLLTLAGLVYALRGKLGEAVAILKGGIQWPWFSLAVLVYFIALALISWRLEFVFRVQEVKVNFWEALYLSFIAQFFNLFFPSALGGDVVKGYYAYQYSGKKLGSFTGVLLDRLLGLTTMILIGLVAFMGHGGENFANPLFKRTAFGALGFLILGTTFFANPRFAEKFKFLSFLIPSPKWRQHLADLYQAIRKYGEHKDILFTCLALSVVAQLFFFLDGYFLSRSLNLPISAGVFFILMPIIGLVSMAPSLSGLGVREAGFVFFFRSIISTEQAFALSILYDVLLYGFSIAAGLLFAFRGGLKRGVLQDLEAVEEEQLNS